ncbi:MAG: hypothetical protein KF833_11600 [Verrucomicrobiae bacterium]|nr:hypothetical protein [Verrucomicrobiae bacterium]
MAFLFTSSPAHPAGPRDALWHSVAQAVEQGLPQTALERLAPILEGARADQAWAEWTKAVGRRIALETQIQGHRPEERITRFQRAFHDAPAQVRPVFHALLGHAYWAYFQQNRWRVSERTPTTTEPGEDFQTWDLPRLFAEIDRQFTLALADATPLQAIPIAQYNDLLEPGTVPDRHRPTLYDFLAHEALAFYAAGEQAGTQPADAFTPRAADPILSDLDAFLAWRPATPDTNAVAFRAIRLYQDLLRFHRGDAEPSALLDADLGRLRYAANIAVGPDLDTRALTALRAFAERHRTHELSAAARHDAARLLHRLDRLAEARTEAVLGRDAFPASPGGQLCANLIREIEAPSAQLQTERVWNAPWPTLDVTHKNLDQLWFRLVPADWNAAPSPPEALDLDARRALLARSPARTWSHPLPATPEYQERLTRLPVPEDLPHGFHYLLASRRADFAEEQNEVTFSALWISDLAVVLRSRAGRWEGLVLEARSGEPVPGATIAIRYHDARGQRRSFANQNSDADGAFGLDRPDRSRAYTFTVTHRNRTVGLAGDAWWHSNLIDSHPTQRTVFFTDRALYRPGQLLQYKGVSFSSDSARHRYQPLAGREVTVLLRDLNGQEIARARHRANDFGSFHGTFTTPREGPTGYLHLVVEGEPAGETHVRVEEYKRPTFQVLLDPPVAAPRLRQPVSVSGRALAYTGAPADGAQVTWRVTRQVRFPGWFIPFRGWPDVGQPQEIAQGTAVTAPDGSFAVEFPALPDESVAETSEPAFRFLVHADVTDRAGETRSAQRTVTAGYTALTAELDADAWQTAQAPVVLRIATRTLDGDPAAAEGTVRIHRLNPPPRVVRPPLDRRHPGLPEPMDFDDDADNQPADTPDAANPNQWPLGGELARFAFRTDAQGTAAPPYNAAPGAYRALLETRDRFDRPVTARHTFIVLDPDAPRFPLPIPSHLAAPSWSIEAGDPFVAVWGTGYESGRAFVEIERDHRLVERFWTQPGRTQQRLQRAVPPDWRGGFTLHLTYVRENRAYTEARRIEVPWSDKEFDLSWETFRSQLEPGTDETWTLKIQPRRPSPNAPAVPPRDAAAELVATLYDASLDAFAPFHWRSRLFEFPTDHSTASSTFANQPASLQHLRGAFDLGLVAVHLTYRRFPDDLIGSPLHGRLRLVRGAGLRGGGFGGGAIDSLALGMPVTQESGMSPMLMARAAAPAAAPTAVADLAPPEPEAPPAPSPATVSPRRNLQETAFFLPHLLSDSNGVVRLTFKIPEALTEWRFLGLAHDRQLRSGHLEARTVTARDLMVRPNPPRFLREGDVLEFSTRVVNRSDTRQQGRVRLSLAFALDDSPADEALANDQPEQDFDIPPNESRAFAWRLRVPDGCGFLTYRVTAAAGRVTDGEEGALPVLSRRIFLTESLPLPIRGPGTHTFDFASLRESAASPSLRHQALTVQMVSNPAWYAVLALPYLMEFPHECAEQVFNRLYANALARHIANRDPRIRTVFDQWRATPALDSPLERHPDLNAIALAETPWLRDARNQSEARRRIGILFEDARLQHETERALAQLEEAQLADGAWSWFPGGSRDPFISLYIVAGFGRLRHLGIELPPDLALAAIPALDDAMHQRWRRLRDQNQLERPNLDPQVALYLYARAFFLADRPVADIHRESFDYWLTQARTHWLQLPHRQSRAHLALAFHRLDPDLAPGLADLARHIVRSLREHAVRSQELGMFWRDDERAASWFRAPIETQALMIEAFDEIAADRDAVEDLQVWLLKQKQTQNWKTTKATADATYAILLRGADLLASTRLVEVSLGGQPIQPGASVPTPNSPAPSRPEPGTGFYEVRLPAADIAPALAAIRVSKSDPGIAWGAAHWQYFEDVDRVRPHQDGPLQLTKSLFTRANTPAGPRLDPVRGPVRVGDELIVRVELRADRDFEYVHLKDQRGSGTEPVNVLSGHRFQDGLGYYESTRDTASHFFISYLPKGTYVFEYPVRVQHRGRYPTGIATVQCMYAPEFNSHSASLELLVE